MPEETKQSNFLNRVLNKDNGTNAQLPPVSTGGGTGQLKVASMPGNQPEIRKSVIRNVKLTQQDTVEKVQTDTSSPTTGMTDDDVQIQQSAIAQDQPFEMKSSSNGGFTEVSSTTAKTMSALPVKTIVGAN